MGWLGKILIGVGTIGLGGFIVKKLADDNKEEQRRRDTPCEFNDSVSYGDFCSIVYQSTRYIKRLTVNVEGPIIYGTVRSQSGISSWRFKIDFNDYGKITGRYWISSDNTDSIIPQNLAEHIQNAIKNIK